MNTTTINKTDPRALEHKVASALTDDTASATDLAQLIIAVETAITQADSTVKAERIRAMDPALSPDPRAARDSMEDAEFSAARLRVLLPRLEIKQTEAAEREYLARWQEDFAALKIRRDQLATTLADVYQFTPQLATVLGDIAALDIELSRLHQSRPSGISLHLDSAELVARGLESFSRDNPSIASTLVLPDFTNAAAKLWPPRAPSLATLMGSLEQPHLGANWWQESEARTAARLEESKQLATYYENQQRIREEREANP